MYATHWHYRVKNRSTTQSYRLTELQNLSSTGLLFGQSYYADSLYYHRIADYALLGRWYTGHGRWLASPMHDGTGIGGVFMDGHSEFMPRVGDDVVGGHVAYDPAYEWLHRKFWGRTKGGDYISRYYVYQP
jgi:hypothetical protein